MANPQKENGFTSIANELLEALCATRISGEARQCLDVIFRKTYGFNKKEDAISLSQFCALTKMPKATVCRALSKLLSMGIIIDKNDNGNGKMWLIVKDFTTWKPLTKKIIVDKNDNGRYQKRQSSLTKKGHTKETSTKETITKEILLRNTGASPVESFGNKEINEMIEVLKLKTGVAEFADVQRWSRIYARHCLNLMKKIGATEFSRRLDFLIDDPFTKKNCNKIKFIYNNVKGFIEPTATHISLNPKNFL